MTHDNLPIPRPEQNSALTLRRANQLIEITDKILERARQELGARAQPQTPVPSPNTQAILLLTAPLIDGGSASSPDLLSPVEYKRLARHLRELQRQPADLVSTEAAALLRACQPVIDAGRLQRLLGRGFLLSQALAGPRNLGG